MEKNSPNILVDKSSPISEPVDGKVLTLYLSPSKEKQSMKCDPDSLENFIKEFAPVQKVTTPLHYFLTCSWTY